VREAGAVPARAATVYAAKGEQTPLPQSRVARLALRPEIAMNI